MILYTNYITIIRLQSKSLCQEVRLCLIYVTLESLITAQIDPLVSV